MRADVIGIDCACARRVVCAYVFTRLCTRTAPNRAGALASRSSKLELPPYSELGGMGWRVVLLCCTDLIL
jgi:hypothetical protein